MLDGLSLLVCVTCNLPVPVTARAIPVDVELVLAVDVSESMDKDEFALQRAGYVAALRHRDFIDAVRTGANGRIALAYFEWAGTIRQDTVVSWQIIDSAESANAFADRIEASPFKSFRGTSISGALLYGKNLFENTGFDGERRVIDISGDGPNNIGVPVTGARDEAVAGGIIVNGLPILIRPSPTFNHLDSYYEQCVTGGPGSFVLPIYSVSEFSTAIRRKLVLEVSGIGDAKVMRVDSTEPVDCQQGERDRRFFSDPYFPELDK